MFVRVPISFRLQNNKTACHDIKAHSRFRDNIHEPPFHFVLLSLHKAFISPFLFENTIAQEYNFATKNRPDGRWGLFI